MSYPKLYEFAQGLEPKVRRKAVRDEVLRLSGKNRIATVKTSLDTSECRGFYLDARNEEHPLVGQLGCDIVVLARGMNYCWDRMVYVKELTHVFDPQSAKTNTPEGFEVSISQLITGDPNPSAETIAEWYGIWMALSIFCPESKRLQYASERENGSIDDYSIALQLKIPQIYVPNLFEDRYRKIVEFLLATR